MRTKVFDLARISCNPIGPIRHSLINTPLQRGVLRPRRHRNRFNGFYGLGETVETVPETLPPRYTPLKRGVNGRRDGRRGRRGRLCVRQPSTLFLWLAMCISIASAAETSTPKENVFATKPLGIQLSIKMVGPYSQPADLQIICLFKHKPTGDTYQGAAKETDEKLAGILSALRNRGEFVGESGETFLFTPPKSSIPAKQFMVIGLGEEKDVSLDTLRVVGRIAAREAVRLKARHIAWAPVIRDEGNSTIDVGEGDRAFAEQMLSAYDTEKRLQAQDLAPKFSIESLVIEAGPTFFDAAVKQVGEGIESIAAELGKRDAAPYRSLAK